MDHDLQMRAQQRVDRIGAFRAELEELEQEQALVLAPEQRARLEAHLESKLAELKLRFGVDTDESTRRFSWGMRIATLLGGAAFFAATVLFLHRVWGLLPPAAQVIILTLIPLALLAAADRASRKGVAPYYTAILALAAGAAFFAGLTALGTTFNMAPSPHSLLVWGLFAILVAYAFGLRIPLGAGLLLLCAYSAAIGVSLGGVWWTSYVDRAGFLIPGALVCYAIASLGVHRESRDFDFVYRLCGAGLALVALLTLSMRGDLCCGVLPPRMMETLYQLVGLVLAMGVVLHGLRLGRSGLVNLGAAGFVVFLYVRLHAWWWDWMPKYLFFLVIGLIAVGLLLVFQRLRARVLRRSTS